MALTTRGSCAAPWRAQESLPDIDRSILPSAQNLPHPFDAFNQSVDLRFGVVKPEGGSDRGRNAKPVHNGLSAVMPCANGYSLLVKNGANVMRVNPFHNKRERAYFFSRRSGQRDSANS